MNILVIILVAYLVNISSAKYINGIVDDEDDCRYMPDLRFNPKKHIYFSLYTRDNLDDPQNITIGNISSLLTSNYKLHRIIKIYVHGVCGGPDVVRRLRSIRLFTETPEINVIMVDWNRGSLGTLSLISKIVPEIGIRIAELIDWLILYGVRLQDIHLVGSSMGCHVIGFTGRNIKSGLVPYILACDPPNALYRAEEDKLKSSDAAYVEVIHTNGAYFGIHKPVGHSDFYPNGGYEMPGCEGKDLCSHMKACIYYFESLGNENYAADQCENYEEILNGNCSNIGRSYLGGMYPKNITGIYYLKTFPESPYYRG